MATDSIRDGMFSHYSAFHLKVIAADEYKLSTEHQRFIQNLIYWNINNYMMTSIITDITIFKSG